MVGSTEPAAGMDRFASKTAIVTGAAAGIGRAVALRLSAEGATVACLDLDGEAALETVKTIAEGGGQAVARRVDVSVFADVEAAVAEVTSEMGPCDVVANVAGIGGFAHSHEESPERFERIVSVNLNGTFHLCRAVLPGMVERGAGVIINTASNAGIHGSAWSAAYAASKGGVVMLTRALAYEYQETGIRVNAVAPGGVLTGIHDSFAPPEGADWRKLRKMMSPLPMAEPAEIAALFAYIGSDEARFMTGSIVSIDGGLTA
jgi:NAD(P)-dependent dehydrogenase (short-subunit alcohol dehydrogenase family)